MKIMNIVILIMGVISIMAFQVPGLQAQDETEQGRKIVPPVEAISEIPEMPVDELLGIIDRADNFFADQGVENMAVDIIVYRDPSGELTLDDLKDGSVCYKARLTPIFSHYFYAVPGWYQLKIMGMIMASSEMVAGETYTSLLPLPGAQVDVPYIRDNYDFTYIGKGKVDDRGTYRVRVSAKDQKKQFIRYSIYDYDIEQGYLAGIESHFDNGFFKGHGSGQFYYQERDGKLLPAYGKGEIYFLPGFRIKLWGSWYKWEFNSEDFDKTLGRGEDDVYTPIDVGGGEI